jgi:2-oxoisovalerate ferredoxin oxidoreductase delta subunit
MGSPISLRTLDDYPELAVSCADTTYNKTGLWRVMRPEIDHDACTQCLICWKFCPDCAVEIVEGFPRIKYEFCKGCGICAEECPASCITFRQEER